MLSTGDRAAAVDYYLTGIGVPEEITAGMRDTPSWAAMAAAPPTLAYDCLISEATSFELLTTITVPTLVLDSEGSGDDLQGHGGHRGPGDAERDAPKPCRGMARGARPDTGASADRLLSPTSRVTPSQMRPLDGAHRVAMVA